jgi:hypothetical protein
MAETWYSIANAPEEVSREEPVLVLTCTTPPDAAATRPWLPIAAYRTGQSGWRNVADERPLTTAMFWTRIPAYPAAPS